MTTNLPTVSQSVDELERKIPSSFHSTVTPDHRKTDARTTTFSELPPLPSDHAFRSMQTQPENSNRESGYHRKKRRLSQSVQTKTRRKLNLSMSAPTLVSSAKRSKHSSWKYTSTAPPKNRPRQASNIFKDFDQHLKTIELDESNTEWDNQAKIKKELDFNAHILSELAQQMREKSSDGSLVISKIAERNSKLYSTLYSSHISDHRRLTRALKLNETLQAHEHELEDHISQLEQSHGAPKSIPKLPQGSVLLKSKLSQKLDDQHAEIASNKQEIFRLNDIVNNRDQRLKILQRELERLQSKLVTEDGKSVEDLFISKTNTRFLFIDNVALSLTDKEFWIQLEPFNPIKHTGKFPADPEASRMADIVEFSSDEDAKLAKNILNAQYRVSFAQEFPVAMLTMDCSIPMEVLVHWFGKLGKIKKLKCAPLYSIIAYHDVKAACAALVYFSGRRISSKDQTYKFDIRFANDTGHIVWDHDFSRETKQKSLEQRCFHLAYVLDLLEKEVYVNEKPKTSSMNAQLESVALDMETRLENIAHRIEEVRKRTMEEIEVSLESNENQLKTKIRDLEMKNQFAADQVEQVKTNLNGVTENYRSLQRQKYTRKAIIKRSLEVVEGTTTENDVVVEAVAANEKELEKSKAETTFLQKRLDSLQKDLAEFTKVKHALEQAKRECEKWKKKCEASKGGRKTEPFEGSRKTDEVHLGEKAKSPEDWREMLEAKLKEHQQEIATYREKVKSLEGSSATTKASCNDSEEVKKLRAEIKTLQKKLESQSKAISGDEHGKLIELQHKFDVITNDLKQRENEIECLKEQLQHAPPPKRDGADPARILLNMTDNIKDSLTEKGNVQEYETRISHLKVEIKHLEELLAAKRKEISNVQHANGFTADIDSGRVGSASSEEKRRKEREELEKLPDHIRAELLELRNHREICTKLHGVFEEVDVDETDVERLSSEHSRPSSRSQTSAVVKKLIKERDSAKDGSKWKKLLELEQRSHMETKKRYRKEFQKVQAECERLQDQIDGKQRSTTRRKRLGSPVSAMVSRSSQTEAQFTTSGVVAPPSPSMNSMDNSINQRMGSPSQQMINLQQRNRFLEIQLKNMREKADKEALRAEQHSKWLKIIQAQKMKEKIKRRVKPMVVESPKLPPPKEKRAVDKKWRMTRSRFLQITKSEHAERPLRAKTWLLRTIGEIYAGKRKADAVAIRGNFDIVPLPEFIYHEYLPSKLGIKDLIDATCWDIHNAVQNYAKSGNPEVILFQAFLEEEETIEVLSFYISTRDFVEAKAKNGILDVSRFSAVIDVVFPQATCAWRFDMAETLELHAFALTGKPEIDIHEALRLFVEHFKTLIVHYRTKCIKLFFQMGLSKQANVAFSDFLPLIRVILSDVGVEKLQAAICRLKPSKIGSMPIQQFLDTVEDLHHLRLQFHVPTCASMASNKQASLTKFVAERWKKLQTSMLDEVIDTLGSLGGSYTVLAPIRRDVCMIRDLASHLNTCLVNGFSWEALSTFSAILRMLNDVFDTFELVTSGSDLKSAYAFISRQEGIVYKRVCDIVDQAQDMVDRSIQTQARFHINPNQQPSDEKDRVLQKMVMEEFATNVHVRMNLTPLTPNSKSSSRQQAWVTKGTKSEPTLKRNLSKKSLTNSKMMRSPKSVAEKAKPFRGNLRTADGPEVVKIAPSDA